MNKDDSKQTFKNFKENGDAQDSARYLIIRSRLTRRVSNQGDSSL